MKIFNIFLFFPLISYGSFFTANEAIEQQQYSRALSELKNIPGHSFARYFNEGYLYLQQGNDTRAWLSFERARQLAPYHKALKPAFKQLPLSEQQQRFIPWYQTKFCSDILFCAILCFVLLFSTLFVFRPSKKNAFIVLVGIILLVSDLELLSTIAKKGVVIKDNCAVHISPVKQTTVVANLKNGTPVTIREQVNRFAFVKLGQGKTGWISLDDLEFILEP